MSSRFIAAVRVLALVLVSSCGGSSGSDGRPGASPGLVLPIPDPPALFTRDLGRGLADPTRVAPVLEGRALAVLEGAPGRIAVVDLDGGAVRRVLANPAIPVTAIQVEPGGATLLALATTRGTPPCGAPWEACGHTIYRVDLVTAEYQALPFSVVARGFFLDATGAHAFTSSDGIDRIDLATGARERLETCQGTRLEAMDVVGGAVFSTGIAGGTPNTGYARYVGRCDLATDARTGIATAFPETTEALAVACAQARLFRGEPRRTGGAPPPAGTRLPVFRSFDATTLDEAAAIEVAAPYDASASPGPAAADAACERVWWAASGRVFEWRAADESHRMVADGVGRLHGWTDDVRDGSVIAFGPLGAGEALERIDLATGERTSIVRDLDFDVADMAAVALLPERNAIAIALAKTSLGPDLERQDASTVAFFDLGEERVAFGDLLSDAWFPRLATCGSPTRLFGIGTARSAGDGWALVEIGPNGFEAAPVSIPEPASPAPPEGWVVGPEDGFGMSRDCRFAYFLDKGLRRFDLRRQRTEVLPSWGSTLAMDPRQDVLYLYNQSAGNQVRVVDLVTLEARLAAVDVPFVDRMMVTHRGELVLGGDHSLGIGVLDLTTGASRRLWEGAGPEFPSG